MPMPPSLQTRSCKKVHPGGSRREIGVNGKKAKARVDGKGK
jgi:hypothetical protein